MNKHYRIPIRMLSISHRNWNAVCKADYGPEEVQRSCLLNGIGIAATKTFGAQMGACTIMYQVGSRYETDDSIGASHFLRAASGASSRAFSGFTKTRFLAQRGVSMTCTSDRQSIAYTLRCPVSIFPEMKCFLLDAVIRCCFRQWEMDDLKPMLRDDLYRIPPEQRVIDLVQKACWAGPLSNSVFCPAARINAMTGKMLSDHFDCNFKTDHCTLGSTGVPFEETLKLAEAIEPRRERPCPRMTERSCARAGFELYDLGAGSDTWICLAVPSCGTCNIRELFKHSIIANACGTGNMQDGSHRPDHTPQHPMGYMAADDVYTSFKAFNISYFETGLFGIVVRSPAYNAWKATLSASQFFSNIGDLDDNQINVGKQRLKLSLAIHDENCVKVSEGLALQAANGIQLNNAKASIQFIDCICNEEIKYTAKCLAAKCKYMAYAAVGDIGQVPHDRELLCGS